MIWMKNEVICQNVFILGYYGGIIFDEMLI